MDHLQRAKDAFEAGDEQMLEVARTAALIAIAEGLRAILGAIVTVETAEEGWRGES